MPVGNIDWPDMPGIAGIELGVAQAGIKKAGRDDVLLLRLCEGASVAGVFTKNAFCAEPVKMCKKHMAAGSPRYLLINSGNANACTGQPGWNAAQACCDALADLEQVGAHSVLPFSTGVIGEVLPADKIIHVLPVLLENLSEDNWARAARSIMTTDTQPKGVSIECFVAGAKVRINGIAKGAGMIKPDMATMLAYMATDAAITPELLQILCKRAADKSFNRITIDGDTSTNDAFMLMASGKSQAPLINDVHSEAYRNFETAFIEASQNLAQFIVRDGEGASKYVEVEVRGGATEAECLNVAYEIAHSPLVKTAFFASDANWGRLVMAIGKADVKELDSNKVNVWLNDVALVEEGGRAASYTEEAGQAEMQKDEIRVLVDLGRGEAKESIWTSDLSHEYVRINAEYRT